jgi:hypothetical protein
VPPAYFNREVIHLSAEYTVSVEGWLGCAWSVIRSKPNLLLRGLGVILLFSLIGIVLGMVPGGSVLVLILQVTVGPVLQAGWYLFCLRLIRDESTSPAVMFEPFRRFGRVWLVTIVVPIIVAVGLILFIIPGLYLWARYGMAIFAAVDRDLDAGEALEFSSRITEGDRLKILLLHLLLAAVGVLLIIPSILEMENLGAITVLAYLFILTPLAGTSYAAAYDSLVDTKVGREE